MVAPAVERCVADLLALDQREPIRRLQAHAAAVVQECLPRVRDARQAPHMC